MENKYLIATAFINGQNEEFYRNGSQEGFCLPKTYSEREITYLQSEIKKFRGRIKNSFNRAGRIYSDDYSFLKNEIPEVLVRVLENELSMKIYFYGQGTDYIFFSNENDYKEIINRFNEHFKL